MASGHSALFRVLRKLIPGLPPPPRSKADEKHEYPETKKGNLEDFEFQQTLGRGAFGRVFLAKRKTGDDKPLAVKRLKKEVIIRSSQVDHTMNERNVLARMHHPFIVELDCSFQDQRYLYLAMDFVVGGEFFGHLRKCRRFDDVTARFYLSQLIMSLEYIHAQGVVYRDLKPENILMTADGYLKMTDFGLAKEIEFRTYTLCGTPDYFAPEILLCRGYGKPVDWWALGIVMYEMLVGYPPFVAEDPLSIYKRILDGKFSFPDHVAANARGLIRKLVTADLTKRFGNLKGGSQDIRHAAYFSGVPFPDILARKIVAPYKPTVKSVDDCSNFKHMSDSVEEPKEVPEDQDPFKNW